MQANKASDYSIHPGCAAPSDALDKKDDARHLKLKIEHINTVIIAELDKGVSMDNMTMLVNLSKSKNELINQWEKCL